MDFFFALVSLISAIAWIAAGYILWKAPAIMSRMIEEAIRKQDDRLRKRFGGANGKQEQGTQEESQEGPTHRRGRAQAGQSVRRKRPTGD